MRSLISPPLSIGIFESPKYDVNPHPNTRGIGLLVGRTSRYRRSVILVLAIIMPPFEKGGAYCFAHVGRSVCRSVGMSVALNLVQLITQERFAPEASNLVGR